MTTTAVMFVVVLLAAAGLICIAIACSREEQ